MTDWIATFPAVFQDSPAMRSCLQAVEKAGFEKAIQRAAQLAATYALEDDKSDSLCREIAREISAEVWHE